MYGISAARRSPRAASKAAAIRSIPVTVLSATGPLHDLGQVLVAATGEAEDVEARLRRVLEQPGDGVRGLERGDDALQARELLQRRQRFGVADGEVAGA